MNVLMGIMCKSKLRSHRLLPMKKLLLTLPIIWLAACSPEPQRQNVVFILVDDLGWTDLGYSGSTFYESPNIDALSQESMIFSQAYAGGSVCSPSRAAIMSGKHPARVNITDWIPGQNPQGRKLIGAEDLHQLPLEEHSLAEAFKGSGYQTFFAGKWHLGSEGFYPETQGFDLNQGGHEKGSPPGGYYSPYKNPKLEDGPEGEYLTDRLVTESIDFMRANKESPFFLFLSFYNVHTPIQACKRHLPKFQAKLDELGNTETQKRIEGEGTTRLDQYNPQYASMVYAMDENVGRIINNLKKLGLYENTTIVFTSDNGGLSTLSSSRKRLAPTSVLPLRGGKGWLYEGGIRVPLLIKPAGVDVSNKDTSVPVVGQDLYPTLLSLANIAPQEGQIIDGKDLSPILLNSEPLDRDVLYWHFPHYHGSGWIPGAAIRLRDWKLIEFYETNHTELYHLGEDIAETNELSKTYPDTAAMLLDKLHDLQASMHANSIRPNPDYESFKGLEGSGSQ